jgi:hypothetical protein
MTQSPAFQPLAGIYEPSAIQQLADGRFLVVEDEKEYPFSLVRLSLDGRVASQPLRQGWLDFDDAFWKLDDLEGLALGPDGLIYAITSHSRSGDGDEKKARDKLVRFRIEGDRVVERQVSKGLKPVLRAAHPVLAQAAEVRDVKGEGGLNIEALEFTADGLLVGLRGPLLDGRAVLIRIGNPEALFKGGDPATTLTTLDLDGHGLRGLSWLPALGGYLAIAGPVARAAVPFRLWFWSGRADQPARRVEVPGLAGFEHAEGVCPALIEGRERIVMVSDDGNRDEGRFARFVVLEPGQLRIAA